MSTPTIRILPEWNVKIFLNPFGIGFQLIRILPEWNVKDDYDQQLDELLKIRILPEWNVKVDDYCSGNKNVRLESYQSGM